ncbi:MAG: MCE family protein [Deltaproteobacteria bacterium]|nr:MCE family protein [Deltaproteobacteria bacterium]
MSKKASTTAIGAFVIGAVLLAVAGVVIFGSGKYFTKKYNYVAYFSGSVKGLNVGAPVLFKGVKVGDVTHISMEFDAKDMALRIAVTFQLVENSTDVINEEFYEGFEKATQDQLLLDLVNSGLRAQLAPLSLITGMLYIKLDFFPEKVGTLRGTETLGSDFELTEIPAVPSDMEEFSRTLENLPFKRIAQNLENMTTSIERLVSSPKLLSILNSVDNAAATFNQTMITLNTQMASLTTDLKTAINNTNRLVRNLNHQVEPMAKGFIDTTDAATGALNQARDTLSLEKGPGAELVASMKQAVESATSALEQADTTLATIDELSSQDSEVIYTLNTALEEIAMAARSIRAVAEYLERHPESLLKGKRGKGGQ